MRLALHPGRLRHRVGLSTIVLAEDGKGGQTATPQALRGPSRVPAEVTSLGSEERLRGGTTEAQMTHRVLLRYRDDVTARTRVTWDDRVLEVVGAPIAHGHRQWLECLCVERAV